ncbi:MAG: Zn-dependent alcohol dehydrogenase [Candidatus Latescibacterota bacterium]|nr:Zn-dependent alcohol dehydrogenase [Candidatus Latescibacterota bacterium]
MKAAVLYEPNTKVVVEELDIDSPHQGEVLLDMVGAGVCHSDYHYVDGHLKPRGLPLVMGHEGAGVVKEVGPGVTSVAAGDKIILSLDAMCGYCRNCSEGSPALCETHRGKFPSRISKDGKPYFHGRPTYTEQSVVLANACVKVPDDTPLEKTCLISCAVITGIGAVVNRAKVEAGASMAVFGCGGVGLNAIQGGVLASAGKIIAVDKVPYKLELAEQFGATHLVNADKEDPVRQIKEITGGGADYAFEVVGFPALVRQAFESVRMNGTALMIGVQPTGADISVDAADLMMDRAVMGSFHGAARARVDFLWILDLYRQGKIKLDELISQYRPLDEINEAFEDMVQGKVARTVLVFN